MEIDLDKIPDNGVELMLARSRALEVYAGLEQSLCMLLSVTLRTDMSSAAIIFFRVANAKSRNQILESLIKKRYDGAFNDFWFGVPGTPNKRGLMSLVRDLDSKRNEIVHWHTMTSIDVGSNPPTRTASLVPPNFWQGQSSQITIGDIGEFCRKADFTSRSTTMFCAHHGGFENPSPITEIWHRIYQRPCTYPPANTHPLNQN